MKRYLAALAIGGAVFGTVLASAASLGTITDGTLGASEADVDSCQDGITTEYVVSWDGDAATPTGDTTADRYEVTGVQVNGLDAACEGKRIGIVLTDGDVKVAENSTSHVVADVDGTTPAPNQTFSLNTSSHPSAADVDGIRVVIYGE